MGNGHYEDEIDIVGEVRTADLDARTFVLLVNGSQRIAGRFAPEQEALLTEALHQHGTLRLRVRGRARFDQATTQAEEFTEVDSVAIEAPVDDAPSQQLVPFWQTALEIGATISEEDLARIPRDLAARADEYLDETAASIWDRISGIAARVSDEDLAKLPADFVRNADKYLDED
jgi:hypothetical protein